MIKVLLLEDDMDLSSAIQQELIRNGYSVDCLSDGETGMLYALNKDYGYDLAIVDRMLPVIDGLTIIKAMRRKDIQIPVIIITGMSALDDRIDGLDGGADDYLVKPFAFEELLARIRVMIRRQSDSASDEMTLADLTVDAGKHLVTRGGKAIELSAKEFAVLEYLMRHQGQVLSREQIEQHVWDFDYEGGSNMVDVYIRYLRRKLDEGYEKKLIHTVRGAGYVMREQI